MRTIFLELSFVFIAQTAVVDRVAVVVGNDVITQSEVDQEVRLEEFYSAQPLDLSPQLRYAAANRLVDQQLIRQEIETAAYQQPDPSKADAMLHNFQQQHFRNEADFRSALQRYGLTEDQAKQYLLWQLTVIQFTDERFHAGTEGPGASPGEQSANRSAPGPVASEPNHAGDRIESADTGVDQQLDAWLKQARSSTRIEFKKEAFQ